MKNLKYNLLAAALGATIAAIFIVGGMVLAQVVPINFFGLQGSTLRTILPGYNLGLPMATPQFTASSTQGTAGTLPTSTSYFFEVIAGDGVGTTTPSNELNLTTGTTTPSLTLQWGVVPGAAAYRVYYATSTGAEGNYFNVANTTTTLIFATTTTATANTSTPQSFTSAYADLVNASGSSQLLTGPTQMTSFILQGSGTSTCYKYVATSTGAFVTSTITCL